MQKYASAVLFWKMLIVAGFVLSSYYNKRHQFHISWLVIQSSIYLTFSKNPAFHFYYT